MCLHLKFIAWNAIFVLLSWGSDKSKQSNGDDTLRTEIVTDMVFGTHSYCFHFIYVNGTTVVLWTKADQDLF